MTLPGPAAAWATRRAAAVTARVVRALAVAVALMLTLSDSVATAEFDHQYATLADLLRSHIRGARVDYAGLKAGRSRLDAVAAAFAAPDANPEPQWSREQRMAFWINAYNVFTLQAIVDHYPIQSRWLTIGPRNSIRQIDGVWTTLSWPAAGRRVTLDDIEHRILRPVFGDARIHFAVNCASVSCPPLAEQPYRAATLDAQLDAAGRRYLSSAEGLQVNGTVIAVSSLFKWYGDDFIARYASKHPGTRAARERAILGAVSVFGPASTATALATPSVSLRFLDYDWSLNDLVRR